jgi:Heterokaryon incompatibility protein (HET)
MGSMVEQLYLAPLDPIRKEIRLLSLQKTESSQLQFALTTASLDDNVLFYALSYCWGDPDVTESVQVNGKDISVTTNLKAALTALCELEGGKYLTALWVDAISIDQTHSTEKNHQVFLMRDIYSRAARVISWIGHDDDSFTTEACFERFRLFSTVDFDNGPRTDTFDLLPETNMLVLHATLQPYWERIWVVQEIMLAQEFPLLVCGSSSIEMRTFMQGIETLCIHNEDYVRVHVALFSV